MDKFSDIPRSILRALVWKRSTLPIMVIPLFILINPFKRRETIGQRSVTAPEDVHLAMNNHRGDARNVTTFDRSSSASRAIEPTGASHTTKSAGCPRSIVPVLTPNIRALLPVARAIASSRRNSPQRSELTYCFDDSHQR